MPTQTAPDAQQDQKADMARLVELVHQVPFAMLTTDEPSGELRSRPMAVQEADFDGTLRFFTQEHSGKVEDVQRDRNVNVSLSSPEQGIYASLSGTGRISDDQAKKNELWKDEYKEWFPQGKDDPELTILEVKIAAAEYWVIPNPAASDVEKSRQAEHGTLSW